MRANTALKKCVIRSCQETIAIENEKISPDQNIDRGNHPVF